MAQMGCYVPAELAVVPVRDRLLSRIGTGDDMENNVSTFLMEMREVSQVRPSIGGKVAFLKPPSELQKHILHQFRVVCPQKCGTSS